MMMKEAAMLATIVTEFEPMMVIVENCALIAKARAAVRLYPQLAKTQNLTIDGEDSYQQANLSSTNQVKQTLIELWRASKLKSDHQLLVYRFCMDTP